MEVLAAIAVAVFGLTYAWADSVREVAGPRVAVAVSVVAATSMWLAFKLDPAGAIEIVQEPVRQLTSHLLGALDDIGPATPTTTTVPDHGP